MKLKKKKRLQSKRQLLFYYGIIPLFLSVVLVIISTTRFLLHSPLSFSIVVEEKPQKTLAPYKTTPLLQGEKVSGTFRATENNLGIVLVRFFNYYHISADEVIFRIREIHQDSWYYQVRYTVNQFQPHQYFTFGLPEISTSKGKEYAFEIESTAGKPDDAVGLSEKKPTVAVAYRFPKDEVRHNAETMLRFAYKKAKYALFNINYVPVVNLYIITCVLVTLLRFSNEIQVYATQLIQRLRTKIAEIQSPRHSKRSKTNWQWFESFMAHLQVYRPYAGKIIYPFYDNKTKQTKPLLYCLALLLILGAACIARLSFYLDSHNLNQLQFYGLGSGNDYDNLIRNAIRVINFNDSQSQHLLLMYDYPVLLRLYGFFFRVFGLANGLQYLIYTLIAATSFACALPFLLFSRLRLPAIGGFIASLFLATDPFLRKLPAALTVDSVTMFIYALFIAVFLLALKKRNYFLALLLGSLAFFDGFDRVIMLINDPFALFGFAIIYSLKTGKRSKHRPFLKMTRADIVYAFAPLCIFLLLYIPWELYVYSHNGVWWFLGRTIKDFFTRSGSWESTNISHATPFMLIVHVLALVTLTIKSFVTLLQIPLLAFVILLGVLFLVLKQMYKWKVLLLLLIPVLYLLVVYIMQVYIQAHLSQPFTPASYRLKDLTLEFYIAMFFGLELLVMQVLLLRGAFVRYVILALGYTALLIYGIHFEFSDRHFTQVLMVFYIIFALTITVLLRRFQKERYTLQHLLTLLFIAVALFYLVPNTFTYTAEFVRAVHERGKEKEYLTFANSVIPPNSVILAGINEDLVLVSQNTDKWFLYNVRHDSFLIPPKYKPQKLSEDKDVRNQINAIYTAFPLPAIVRSPDEFSKYQFYVLDSGIESWRRILVKEDSHPFIPINTFTLQPVATNSANRTVYRLVLR